MTAVSELQDVRDLRLEAESLEYTYGPNAYSTFIRQHGRRPPREEAAAIGRLLGGRVRADDGTMQPPLSAADKRALKEIKARRKEFARRFEQIITLKHAIAMLAENEHDPADLIEDDQCLVEYHDVTGQIDKAVAWFNRFADYWQGLAASRRVAPEQDR